ncbi:MAG: hypothetical protein K6G78_02800 [bacterium]|nr:hypothetical protein [bacterium]
MRKYAYLKEPLERGGGDRVFKVMLYKAEEGVYLFEYSNLDAVRCSADFLYDSLDDLHEEWDELIDERGWIDLDDPLPDCQHDAFIPLRVRGRDAGKPQWGEFETLEDGEWIDCIPE